MIVYISGHKMSVRPRSRTGSACDRPARVMLSPIPSLKIIFLLTSNFRNFCLLHRWQEGQATNMGYCRARKVSMFTGFTTRGPRGCVSLLSSASSLDEFITRQTRYKSCRENSWGKQIFPMKDVNQTILMTFISVDGEFENIMQNSPWVNCSNF